MSNFKFIATYSTAVLTLSITATSSAFTNNLSSCEEQSVQYTAPSGVISKEQLTIIKTKSPKNWKAKGFAHRETSSPNSDAAFFYLSQPDLTKSGVKNTSMLIYGKRTSPYAWRINIRHHHNTEVKPQWINDELLFLQVWWGRSLSTDAILHAPSGRFIYLQEANYASFNEPCAH